ncbi:MAG: VPDSG-CTERM sorting domain-containing protein [Bryobacteraceae bacterium]
MWLSRVTGSAHFHIDNISVFPGLPAVPDSGTTVAMLGLCIITIAGFDVRKRSAKI